MKKEKKNTLLKGILLVLAIVVLLTWVTPSAAFTEGTFTKGEYLRIGIFDISTYSFMTFNYFSAVFGFLFILAGFSMFVNKLTAYKELVKKIASKFEKKENLFIVISLVFYGVLASIIKDAFILLIFVPFTTAILAELKQSKIKTFVASFGGILLGGFASTFNGYVSSIIKTIFTFDSFTSEIVSSVVLFVIGAALLSILLFLDDKKDKEDVTVNFLDEAEEKKLIKKFKKEKKVNTLPVAIILSLVGIISVLAMIGWSETFGITFFDDLGTSITESTIGGVTVFKFIIGQSDIAFGKWDLYLVCGLLLINTFLLAIIYKVSLDDTIDSYIEGFKRYAKAILIVFLIYVVFESNYFFPTIGIILDWIVRVFGDNPFTWLTTSMITSIFNASYEYTFAPLSEFFTYLGTNSQAVVGYATQLGYGLISFVAPTSMMLAIGLTLLDIDYKKYLKFIWKFFVAMFVISLIVLFILLHI